MTWQKEAADRARQAFVAPGGDLGLGENLGRGQQSDHLAMAAAYAGWQKALDKVPWRQCGRMEVGQEWQKGRIGRNGRNGRMGRNGRVGRVGRIGRNGGKTGLAEWRKGRKTELAE